MRTRSHSLLVQLMETFLNFEVNLSLLLTCHVSDVRRIVSGIRITRTLRSNGTQNDQSDKRKPSDPSNSDSVTLPIPIVTPFLIYTTLLLTLPMLVGTNHYGAFHITYNIIHKTGTA